MEGSAVRLRVEGLSVSRGGMSVCERVSFDVLSGEIVGLVGKSGSGKTTLFHALAGLSEPDAGHVLLDGKDITGKPGNVGYMLQKDLLIEQHKVIDDVCMPLVVKGVRKRDARKRAGTLFQEFGIDGTQDMYPAQLSGGMRQRAALLRTYLMERDVVLLDEPFSALDSLTRVDMRSWLLGMVMKLGLSVVLVTHDVDEAIFLADKVVVLKGSPKDGIPSRVEGVVDVNCPREERGEFMLGNGSLDVKRRILEMLG